MWMGGVPPPRYRSRGPQLVIVPKSEAEIVRLIFSAANAELSICPVVEETSWKPGAIQRARCGRAIRAASRVGRPSSSRRRSTWTCTNGIYRTNRSHNEQSYLSSNRADYRSSALDAVQVQLAGNARRSARWRKTPSRASSPYSCLMATATHDCRAMSRRQRGHSLNRCAILHQRAYTYSGSACPS